ncbi:class F sortase [Geodermatophilus pulveris]|uniref:class F sortase n=1 Tax=Geodermatophilus pulveris TaxID=1564159 RepID=UPI001FE47756|nr:class F sortase [Geodermatophilus pulveris]
MTPAAAGAAPVVADPRSSPEPTAVAVPAIGVSSPLLALGVAADGSAEVPEEYERAGWFDGGGRPGARGPTVLLGHVDSTDGPAVFFDLRELRPGDLVEVTVADGTVARYAVAGTERFAKDAFPTAAVFGATADDVLRLVTCSGEFDRGARSYTDNLVVTAQRVG